MTHLAGHAALLKASAINAETATARGYRSITDADDLAQLGFAPYQRRAPGLLIPIRDLAGEVVTWQYRPDEPRTVEGRQIKYETPHGTAPRFDVPAYMRERIKDTTRPVWITEGARKVDALASTGQLAVGIPGVWSWKKKTSPVTAEVHPDLRALLPHLDRRQVLLCLDADALTNAHVHTALRQLGEWLEHQGASVLYVKLPKVDGDPKTGVDDFLASGGTISQLWDDDHILADLPKLKTPEERFGKGGEMKQPDGRFKASTPDPSTFKPVRWAWSGMVPIGKFSMLVGEEGIGKGTLLAHLAARWSRGELDGDLKGEPATVLFLADEDGFEDTIGPRLMAAGADLSRIRHVEPVTEDGAALVIPEDVDELRRLIIEHKARLVIVDPLDEFTDARVDGWKAKAVRQALAPARQVAQDTESALLAVRHLNKSASSNIRDRISDSHAYNALSRSTLLVAVDNEDRESNRRFVASSKGNLAKRSPVLEFKIEERIVKPRKLPIGVPAVVDLKPSDKSASELLEKPASGTKLERAKEIIREHLADQKPHLVKPVKAAIAQAEISNSTAERAARELGVKATTDNAQPPNWSWQLSPFIRHDGTDSNGDEGTDVTAEIPVNTGDSPAPSVQSLHLSDGEGTDLADRTNPFADLSVNGTKEHR